MNNFLLRFIALLLVGFLLSSCSSTPPEEAEAMAETEAEVKVTESEAEVSEAEIEVEVAETDIQVAETEVVVEVTEEVEIPIPAAKEFDRRGMFENIVAESIMPLHETFVIETEALEQAAYDFRDDPTPETLAQVQAQWRSTAEAWARAEHLGFRFTMIIHNQIKKWPINIDFIEKFITENETPISETFIEFAGSTSKGLAAIEYMIFEPNLTNEEITENLLSESRRMDYMVSLTENLHAKGGELLLMWSAEGDNQAQAFIEADFNNNNIQGSVSMLANEMIVMVEEVANGKINAPLAGNQGTPQPDSVETPLAQHSVPVLINNLRGLQLSFNAGLADYLDYLEAGDRPQPLSTAINEQIETTIVALEAISPNLQTAVTEDPETVQQAFDEAKKLVILFKADMANQLGITVTFSDNDGD